ncbi:MAG: replicative DNA helicase [Clostridia bacterium]|nr:replicative DNA helicase [Clostridia bacterium]
MPNQNMPYNLEAERSVLGCILIDQVIQADIIGELREDDFLVPSHKKIFSAMRELANVDQQIDIITLADNLQKNGKLEDVGGIAYLTLLTTVIPSSANYKQYLDLVLRDGVLRRLISGSNKIIENASNSKDSNSSLDFAQKTIFDIAEQKDKHNLEPIGNSFPEVMDIFERLEKDKNFLTGLNTGFTEFDRMTNGLHKGNLIIIAARPSVGKTTFAMNIAENIALKDEKAVIAVFALEMTKLELAQRMACSVGNVSMDDAMKGKLSEKDPDSLSRLWEASKLMNSRRIYVDESSIQTPQSVLNKCRRLKAQMGRLDLVIVDHMQLMDSTEQKESRQQQITDISRRLKTAAKELDVPLIALSQLSRQVANRNGGKGRPVLSDLRESGAIEQDADVVAFLHRPEEKTEEGENSSGRQATEMREVLIEKNRNGKTGNFNVLFKGMYVKFVNFTMQQAPEKYRRENASKGDDDARTAVEKVPFNPDDLDVPDDVNDEESPF